MGRHIRDLSLNPSSITDFGFTATAGQNTYNLPIAGVPIIFIGGAVQREPTDFTVSDLTVTFSTPLNLNDSVVGYVLQEGKNANTGVTFSIETFSGNNSTTDFLSTYSIPSGSALLVSISGVLQHFTSAYTISNGDTINFTTAPGTGTNNIQVIHLGTVIDSNVPTDNSVDFDSLTTDLQNALHRKNHIINGDFDIWQRDTAQTSNGYGSADRWFFYSLGSTQSVSQQAFTVGQTDVPNNPTFYCRNVVSSVAAAGNVVLLKHML